MNADNFENYITAYIDKELSASDKKDFERLMQSNDKCKVKFDQTIALLGNIKAMPKLETSPDFSIRLQQKIDSLDMEEASFIETISKFIIGSKPALNFALSFGAIAIFTFVYLNDLHVFQAGLDSAEGTKKILNKEYIDIELAGGIDEEYIENEDKKAHLDDIEDDSLDKVDGMHQINLKELFQDVINVVKTKQTFNEEN